MNRNYNYDLAKAIFFMKTRDPYGELSNMYPCKIWFDNRWWDSSEHLYQSFKFLDFETQEKIRLCKSPMAAAFEGRDRRNIIRPDWDLVLEDAMMTAIRPKFAQNKNCKDVLLSTTGRLLVELSFKDDYWGSRPDLSGRNRLGHVLMKHRDELNCFGF